MKVIGKKMIARINRKLDTFEELISLHTFSIKGQIVNF